MCALQDSLIAYWRMDDSLPSTVVLDSSGNGYNGTSVRNTADMHIVGKIGGALQFDGVNDYIDIGNNNYGASPFSVSVWIKISEFTTIRSGYGILGNDGNNSKFWIVIGQTGTILVYYQDFADDSTEFVNISSTETVSLNKWQNIIVTLEQTTPATGFMSLYLDGILISTSIGDPLTMAKFSANFEDNYVGDRGDDGDTNPDFYCTGDIDDVRIYNKALSTDEVKQVYNEGITLMQLSTAGQNLFFNTGV
jgi:hypothetical protein